MNKECRKCKTQKPLTEFWKHKSGKYGVKGYCKVCQHIQNKAYRQKHHYK